MKVVVAIDSFKGSMDSVTAGNAARRGVLDIFPEAEVVVLPVADGGEGTSDALIAGLGGTRIETVVTGPLGYPVTAHYGLIGDMAVMEMAQAAGLTLVPEELRNPLNTTTYGVGELIIDAVERGARSFFLGIGGSATNDCGLGMLTALGCVFMKNGEPAGIYGRDLEGIDSVDTSGLDPRLNSCRFRIACDVSNPLCGPTGASHIFAPQKGADLNTVEWFDELHRAFAALVCPEKAGRPGAGAAGGLGYAFDTFFNGSLERGIDVILEAVGLEKALKGADYVITGEGRIDEQTSMGKTPEGVARYARRCGARVIAVCGSVSRGADLSNSGIFDACFPILRGPCELDAAMERKTAEDNLYRTLRQCFSLIRAL